MRKRGVKRLLSESTTIRDPLLLRSAEAKEEREEAPAGRLSNGSHHQSLTRLLHFLFLEAARTGKTHSGRRENKREPG